MATLDVLARALQSDTLAGFTFKVEGHADPRGDAGAEPGAVAAAGRIGRAVPGHQALRSCTERLEAVGKGSSEPINRARADAPENRRVTIVTVKG